VTGLELEAIGLAKQFGEVQALREFSATVRPGDRIAILGHNGAGKSTLLNILATISKPTAGTLIYRLDGLTLSHKKTIRKQLSLLSHECMLYPDLTALENLRFTSRLHGLGLKDDALLEMIETVGMAQARHTVVRNFSRGMVQRLSLARALLPQPNLLLLDEPFSGLDNKGIQRFQSMFNAQDQAWLLVTHFLELAYEVADMFWVLKRGRLAATLIKDGLTYPQFVTTCRSLLPEEVLR